MTAPLEADKTLFVRRMDCPMCGRAASEAVPLFTLQQLNDRIRVLECKTCGLAFKEYTPSQVLLQQIYGASYVHYSQASDKAEKSAAERVKRMGRPNRRLHLDYGCGGGGLVRCAQRLGWNSYGADPFLPSSLLESDGRRFFKYAAEEGGLLPVGPFEVISLWAVVEHLERPLKTFQGLSRNLNAGGRIYFNVPNAHSMVARKQGSHWAIALLLEHTIFFTEKAIHYVGERLGFDVEILRTCGTPYPYGKTLPSLQSFGLPAAAQKAEPDQGDVRREKPETFPVRMQRSLFRSVQFLSKCPGVSGLLRWALGILGTGDHFYVVMRKK